MTPARWSVLVAVLALGLCVPAAAEAADCPPGSPTLVATVNGKASGPVYTTRDLLVRARLSGGAYYTVNSFDVAGLRRVPDPARDDPPPGEAYGIVDSPGTLTVTANLTNDDLDCTVGGSVSFEVKAATAPIVSRLRRPPRFKREPSWSWDTRFWFWVKPGPTGVASPLTVEARAIQRARVPGPAVPAKQITFPMRPSDGSVPDRSGGGNCSAFDLICPRRIRTWPVGAEVEVRAMGGREVPAFVKVTVTLPRGVPTLHYSLRKTPIGVDVKVLQGGAAVARLRMAGRCDPRGQFARCRFKKLSTAL